MSNNNNELLNIYLQNEQHVGNYQQLLNQESLNIDSLDVDQITNLLRAQGALEMVDGVFKFNPLYKLFSTEIEIIQLVQNGNKDEILMKAALSGVKDLATGSPDVVDKASKFVEDVMKGEANPLGKFNLKEKTLSGFLSHVANVEQITKGAMDINNARQLAEKLIAAKKLRFEEAKENLVAMNAKQKILKDALFDQNIDPDNLDSKGGSLTGVIGRLQDRIHALQTAVGNI
jgi:hypothetical protein